VIWLICDRDSPLDFALERLRGSWAAMPWRVDPIFAPTAPRTEGQAGPRLQCIASSDDMDIRPANDSTVRLEFAAIADPNLTYQGSSVRRITVQGARITG
jgi:hypothetical protein